jgi:hypothetical protein
VEEYYQQHSKFKDQVQILPQKYFWKLIQKLTMSEGEADQERRFFDGNFNLSQLSNHPNCLAQKSFSC